LKSCRARNTEAKLAKQKTIDYYIEHDDRMQYKTYRDKGLMIGSGRMKLSGQKWSIQGAQAVATCAATKIAMLGLW